MAKKTSPEEKSREQILEALRRALAGTPMPLQGSPKVPGIFPGGATGKKLADQAIAKGYVAEVPGPPATGKKKSKPPRWGQITPAGREFIVEQDSPREVLGALLNLLQGMSGEFAGSTKAGHPDARVEIEKLCQTLEVQFGQLRKIVQDGLQRTDDEARKRMDKLDVIRHCLTTVQGAVEHAMHATPSSPVTMPAASSLSSQSWEREIEPYLRSRRDRGLAGDCPLSELFAHSRQRRPEPTIGLFHDVLRRLHSENRIRLTGWSGALENIPEPNLALFVAHKVMYYAHVP